jgi:hypothetical protein
MKLMMPTAMTTSTTSHDDEHDRIDHGVHQALAKLVPSFRIVREPFQHDVQVSRLLACGNRRAIQLREGLREIPQSIGQRVAFHDLRANAEQDTLGARLIVLLGYRKQSFL